VDRQTALNLAREYIPDANRPLRLKDQKLQALKLSSEQTQKIDTNNDQQISQAELAEAIFTHQVDLNPKSSAQPSSQTSLNFVESGNPPLRPKSPEPFKPFLAGPQSLGISDPKQSLIVERSSAEVDTDERDLDTLSSKVTTPDQVATLLDAVNYDTERGKAMGGDGPLGAMAPEDTLQKFSGVCRDIHQLGAYVLSQNGYTAQQVGYVAGHTSHSILSYAKGDSGYGIVEYGRNYSPEDIAQLLGRPALSPREALLALRPEAKVIFGWDPPEKGKSAAVKDIYYTLGHQLYQESLRLKHEDSASFDTIRGLEIEKTLGEHWSVKGGIRGNMPGDPTGKEAKYIAAGYQWGDFDNWGRVSLGAQHRPNEGAHIVGPNTWESNPTTLLGASIAGKVTPFKANLGHNHRTSTTIQGAASGAFAAFNDKKESDAGERVNAGYGFDSDLLTGLPQLNLRVSQNFEGQITKNLSYRSELFVDNDVYLSAAAYGMGGKGFYANVGANAMLTYSQGNFSGYVGGQYLVHQVNNLETSGIKLGGTYKSGSLSFASEAEVFASPEGTHLRTQQRLGLDITERANIFLGAQQEQIFNSQVGNYSNPGTVGANAGIKVNF
jgi:hypothetical protein